MNFGSCVSASKVGDGTFNFVEKVMEDASEDSQFLPPFVSLEELDKDWSAVKNLIPVYRDLKQLESNLNDSLMMAGSEAYNSMANASIRFSVILVIIYGMFLGLCISNPKLRLF